VSVLRPKGGGGAGLALSIDPPLTTAGSGKESLKNWAESQILRLPPIPKLFGPKNVKRGRLLYSLISLYSYRPVAWDSLCICDHVVGNV